MLNYYKTIGGRIQEIAQAETGCWISLIAPTEHELTELETKLSIDKDFLLSALDEEETSRIESEGNQTLIVLDYPIMEKPQNTKEAEETSYYTLPMSIILTDKNVITVCLKENVIINDFASGAFKGVETQFRTQFILNLLLRVAGRYLLYLKQIDKLSIQVEKNLHKSMRNKELIQLLALEKSLVYFSTSLKSIETVLEKILRGRLIKLYDEDQDLLEDLLIEVKQAIEMSTIYSNILSGTMDAFASIISNNLNIVMKVMTIITIVMSVPTVVFSFYGMNVPDLPFATTGFAVGLSAVLAVAAAILLSKSKFYK